LPEDKTLKDEVLREAHESRFATHPESTKMYTNLKEYYWWPNMKREIAEFVSNYGICQQVKIKHQETCRGITVIINSRMEMGGYFYGFCDGITYGKEGE
jgi:hypothetical protein